MQSSLSSVHIKFTKTKEGKGKLLPTLLGTQKIPTQESRLQGHPPHLQTGFKQARQNCQ